MGAYPPVDEVGRMSGSEDMYIQCLGRDMIVSSSNVVIVPDPWLLHLYCIRTVRAYQDLTYHALLLDHRP